MGKQVPLSLAQSPSARTTDPDPITPQIQAYLNKLVAGGATLSRQAVWIQTDQSVLADVQGTIPLPAASLTKVPTSLVALQTYGAEHQFVTTFGITGSVQNGVLQGDLVVQGSQDPFFVWEEAVAVGNVLQEAGIRQVNGNLVIVGKFYMNFFPDPQKSGELLKQGLNAQIWPAEATAQFRTLPTGTARPQVAITGSVQVQSTPPAGLRPLVRHYSYPLVELLKKMNLYSNNLMAQMFADAVGGASVVSAKAAAAVGVPVNEIQLSNGSGLGEENRMSPRAICGLFLALQKTLKPYKLTLGDIFAIVGQDEGVLENRLLPKLLVTKSGTLDHVSTLAGALPTQQGIRWFTIMNYGSNPLTFRTEQGILLQQLVDRWGAVSSLPPELAPDPSRQTKTSRTQRIR